MAQTKQVVLTTTVKTTGAVQPHRFVGYDGKQAAAAAAVLGVTEYEGNSGDAVAVDVIGIVLVEAGAALAAGQAVESDAQGCAVALASGKAAGTALDAASAQGDLIRVLLKG